MDQRVISEIITWGMFYLTPYILYLFQHSSDYIDILFPTEKDNLYIYISQEIK